jgi:hypothetical protein
LEPHDCALIYNTSQREHRYSYDVDFNFDGHRVYGVTAVESPLLACPADGLLGRNVLSVADLIYEGRLKRFMLRFP